MPHDATRIVEQRFVDEPGRAPVASLVPKALHPPQHQCAGRLSLLASDQVPNSREQHGAFSGHSRSSPHAVGTHWPLTCRTVDRDAATLARHGLTELVIGTD